MSNLKSSGTNRNLTLFVTCIRSEGKFLKFFALSEYSLSELKKVETFFREKEYELEAGQQYQRSYQLPPGTICCIKSGIKRTWCRARVQNADLGIHRIAVSLIDYGDAEVIPIVDLRKCEDPALQGLPLAIECVLADVVPPYGLEWPLEAIKFCEQHLLFQKVSGYVVSDFEKFPVVRVAKWGEGEPFVQRLINSALAKIESIEYAAKPEPIYAGPSYKIIQLGINTSHMVTISCISSPQNFYVQLTPAEVELNNLMEAIEQWTNSDNTEYVSSALINTPCLTQLKSNAPHYFRAIIKDVTQDCCKVMLVDYGNVINQKFQVLRAIPKHFLILPAQAIRCALPDGYQMDAETLTKLSTMYRYLTCQILGFSREGYLVRLFHQGEDIMSYVNKIERNIQHNVDFSIEPLQIGTSIEVSTSFVYSLQEFYCQKTAYKNQLEIVTNLLASAERLNMLDYNVLTPAYPVIAKFSEDDLWYRAKVLKADDIYNITVFFIDFGNTDKVKLQDLRMATHELLNVQALAFKFALYDMPSNDGSSMDEACDALESLTANKILKAEIKCTAADGAYSVVLFDTASPQGSINEKIESILNPPRCVYPPVNETEIICIMYYTSPSQIFGQLTKYDFSILSNLQRDMTSFYSALKTRSTLKPKVGDLVSAKFSEDDVYYRARVISLSDNSCKVFFVDYGNTDNVNMADIHELHSKFCAHPIFGIECILENCPASAPIDKVEDLMMDKEIQVALVKEISPGKWLVSLTENYPGNAEILACFDQCVNPNKSTATKSGFVMHNVNDVLPNKPFGNAQSEVRSHSPKPFPPAENVKRNSLSPLADDQTLKRLSDYDAAVVPNGSYKEVYVCLVKNPSEFYCQLISEDVKLQSLMSQIAKLYNNVKNNELNLDDVRVGMSCCAIYEEDGMWYRAKIINRRPGASSCEVLFVDYGNTETVSVSKVKELHSDFFSLTPQALRCGLFNIAAHGGTWGVGAIEAFSEMASDKSFLAQFVKPDPKGTFLVNLLPIQKLTNDVLNEEFIKLGHGHNMNESKQPLVLNSFTASTSLDFTEPKIDFSKSMDVNIVWVTKLMHFFCQLKMYESEFRKMMMTIQEHYREEDADSGVIDRPHSGMICIAQFSNDSAWYRAKIMEVEKQAVKVHYIDYGNSESVSKKRVKYILQDFTILPVQAIKCCVHGIQPSKNGIQENATHLFEGDSKCTFVSKEKDYYLVNLECNGKNVAQELVQMNLALSNEPAKSTANIPLSSKLGIPKSNLSFEKGQLLNVTVSFIANPREFWCQLDDSTPQLDELMEGIEAHYGESVVENTLCLKVESSCVAKYSSDGGWYRAIVKSCPSDQEVEVMFVDYGNSEVVNYSDVRDIHSDFLQLPVQALKCQLYGVPSSYDDDSALKFKEIAEEATELLAKVEKVLDDSLAVTLFASSADKEINLLESAFGISPEAGEIEGDSSTGFLLPKVPLGIQSGYVSSVQNPADFYVQLSAQLEQLEKFSEELQDVYCSETDVPPILGNVIKGASCCALFSEDEAWYRAIITDAKDDVATVLFIDYGNFDTVSKDCLRELRNDALAMPPFAVPCQLANVSSVDKEWSPVAKETFLQLTGDGLLEFTFVNQDVPATISIMKDAKNLADSLIEMGIAVASVDAVKPKESSVNAAENISTDPSQNLKRALASKSFTAKMAFVVSQDKFFISAVEWNEALDTVLDIVEETYGSLADDDDILRLESSQQNSLCAAKYSDDGAWYRAIITEINGDTASVQFIDYGNSEESSVNSLKQLSSSLLAFPACAIECRLADFQAVPGHESEITTLLQSLADDEIEFEVDVMNSQEPYYIKIKTPDGDFLNLLIDKGAVVVSNVEVQKDLENMDSNIQENDVLELGSIVSTTDTVLETYPSRVLTASKFQVKISFVDAWSKFYVTPSDWSEELDLLMEKIEEEYGGEKDTSALIPQSVQVQQSCIAKYSEDDCWYRAIVTSVDGGNVFINFVDYGNAEITELQDLRTVSAELLTAPPFAIECSLFEVTLADGAAAEVTSRLQTLCDDGVILEMEIFDHSLPCRVRIKSDVDFVEQLLQDDLILKDLPSERIQNPEAFKENLQFAFVDDSLEDMRRITIPTRPLPTEGIAAYMKHCHISSDGCIVLHVVEAHLEDSLAEQQESLQVTYSDESKSDLSINIGDYCVAKFPEDSCWYRAVVLERHSDKVIVKFVDFGNSEVISIDSIKELTVEFSEQPNFSMECMLSCVKAVEGCEEVVEERFLEFDGKYQLDFCGFKSKTSAVCVKGITLDDIDIIPPMVEEKLLKQVLPSHYAFDSFECNVNNLHVEENLVLHLSPLCLQEEYNQLKESLKSVYDGFVLSEAPKISLNNLYAIKKDSEYFRAYISSFEDPVVHVFCVDTSITCDVPLPDVRLLYQDFCHIPPFSLQCSLQGLTAAENVEVMKQQLCDLLQGKVLTCTFTGSIRSKNYHEIQMTVDGENILKQLNIENTQPTTLDEEDSKTDYVSEMSSRQLLNNLVPSADDEYIGEVADECLKTCGDITEDKAAIPNVSEDSNLLETEDMIPEVYEDSNLLETGDMIPQVSEDSNFLETEDIIPQDYEDSNLLETEDMIPEVYEDSNLLETGDMIPQVFEDSNFLETEDIIPQHSKDFNLLKTEDMIPQVSKDSNLLETGDKISLEFATDIVAENSSLNSPLGDVEDDYLDAAEDNLDLPVLREGSNISDDLKSEFLGTNMEAAVTSTNDNFENYADDGTDHQVVDMMMEDLEAVGTIHDTIDALTSDAEDNVEMMESEASPTAGNLIDNMREADLPECEQNHTESYQLEIPEVDMLGAGSTQLTDEEKISNQSLDFDKVIDSSEAMEENEVQNSPKVYPQKSTCDDDNLDGSSMDAAEIASLKSSEDNNFDGSSVDAAEIASLKSPEDNNFEGSSIDAAEIASLKSPEDNNFEQNTALTSNEKKECQPEDDFLSGPTIDDEDDAEGVSSILTCDDVVDRVLPLGKVEVSVTEIKVQDNSVFLAVRPTDLQDEFQKLQAKLNEFYSDAHEEHDLNLGPCAVQSDGTWYRGNVLAMDNEDVTVLYSDLGHGETTDTSHIRKLTEAFSIPAPYLVWCILQGFKCTDGLAVSNHLNADVKNSVVSLEVLDEEHPCQVKFSEDNEVINELLSKDLLMSESVTSEECPDNDNVIEKSVLASETPLTLKGLDNVPPFNENVHVHGSVTDENCLIDQNQNTQNICSTLDDVANQNFSVQEEVTCSEK